MKKIIVAISVVASVVTAPSYAAGGEKLYGGIEYGLSMLDDNTRETATAFVAAYGGTATATQDASVGVGRLFFGYRLTPQAAIEGGFFTSTTISSGVSGVTSGAVAYTGAANVKYNGFDLSTVVTPFAATTGDTGFFLRAGIHRSTVDAAVTASAASATAIATASSRLSSSGIGTLFGAGYDLKYAKTAFVRFSATRYLKLAGDSDLKGTVYSIGVGANF